MHETISLRPNVTPQDLDGVRCHLDHGRLDDDDRREMDAYRRTAERRSGDMGRELFDDLIHKSNFIKSFNELRDRLGVRAGHRVLELGSGQAWASALLKRHHPDAHIVASDIAPDALGFATHYEQMLGVQIDEKWAFDGRAMPFADNQFDRVFTFAAFHHFGRDGDYREPLAEVLRVLRPGGEAWLLYEPLSPPWLYKRAHRRVNRRLESDGVAEDVLVVDRLRSLVEELGGQLEVQPHPQPLFREGVKQTLYYALLSKLPASARWTVSTVNLVIRKPR